MAVATSRARSRAGIGSGLDAAMVADGGLRMPKVRWRRVAHCGGSSGGLTPLGANRQWQRQGRGPAVTQGLRAA